MRKYIRDKNGPKYKKRYTVSLKSSEASRIISCIESAKKRMFIPKVTNEKKMTQLHRDKEFQMSSANSSVIYLQRPVDPCSLACFEWSSHDFWSVFRFMMSFSCFLDKNFVTPNSFHLSHARTIAASTRT